MDFLILGPLEVRLGGEPISLGAAKQLGFVAFGVFTILQSRFRRM
jgi:hypothetical protein